MPWSFQADTPIYTQLVARLQEQIVSGAYPPGRKLPSVRDLAADAGVNPNTVQRAFAELERLGMVTKTRSETDRRVIQLDVSPQMTQSLRAYEGPFERAIRLVERSFTPEQIAVFCSILNTFTSEYIKDF